MGDLKGLYVITDEQLTPKQTLLSQVKTALNAGAKIVQLRDKSSQDYEIKELSLKLKKICDQYGALFIMNDRIALAKEVDASGVHIGKEDISLHKARAILGEEKIIGVSCYGDITLAKQMEREGADYVAFGACFASTTKKAAPTIDLNILSQAKSQLSIPICAIGGINHSNISKVAAHGVDMISVVKSVFQNDAISDNVQKLIENMS